jgi:antitoxin HigA-1
MEPYIVIGKKGEALETNVLLHPGEVLSMEIEARGIKKSEFANAIGVTPGNLTELLNGKRHVSAMMAIKIEALLEISASFWLRIQSEYDLGIAKRLIPQSISSKLLRRKLAFKKKETKMAR